MLGLPARQRSGGARNPQDGSPRSGSAHSDRSPRSRNLAPSPADEVGRLLFRARPLRGRSAYQAAPAAEKPADAKSTRSRKAQTSTPAFPAVSRDQLPQRDLSRMRK